MTIPAVWPIKIRNRHTNVWIDASEDQWCKKEEIEPGVWKYGFEYFKPPTPLGIKPDYDYDEPVLRITKKNNTLEILIEDFGGFFTVDIYAFDKMLWADVGGVTKRHVGTSKTVTIPVPPPPPPVPPPPPPEISVVELGDKTMAKLEQLIIRLLQLPNRLDRIEIDTSNTSWVSLRKAGKIKPSFALGFWVESIGGGFDYKIRRVGLGPTKARTAVADDKWDQEFDDIEVKGSGTSGTAVIYYWWREI